MSAFMSEAWKKATLWRIVLFRFFLYSYASLQMGWSSATNQIDLTQLGAWDWFQTIFGCTGQWCLVIIAYLDRSADQISHGELPGIESKTPP